MRLRWCLPLFLVLLFVFGASRAEAAYMDCTTSRQEYARAVAALTQKAEGGETQSRRPDAQGYTVVLFKVSGGQFDGALFQADVLVAGPHGCYTAAYANESDALAAIAWLRTLPYVIYAETDGEVEACEDSRSFQSAGAAEMGFAQAALWCAGAGEGTVSVAVIDSGVYPHSLVSDRLVRSGFDYVDGDEDSTSDTNGHGTHVAGIVADCTPALPVYILPIRVLDDQGKGSIANTTSAIYEAAESGCRIINLSLVSHTHSQALEDAVAFATDCGATVVMSAGNSGQNTNKYCPVHMENAGVIVVGACGGSMALPALAEFSNFGASVDVYAFGVGIRSCSLSGGYTTKSGTSQAAPHVSALCAVLKLLFPELSCGQVEERVKRLAGDGEVCVPNAALLRPLTVGATAERIYLPVHASVSLMQKAEPALSFLSMNWYCDDERIASVNEDGLLSCHSQGTTVLYGDGDANADIQITLHVVDEPLMLNLPSALEEVEVEAFHGTGTMGIYLPAAVRKIAPSAFGGSEVKTVFYSGEQPDVLDFAMQREICLVIPNEKAVWSALEEKGIPYLIDCQ